MITEANVVTFIVGLVGAALVSYVMTRSHPPESENTQLRRRIKDLEAQVDALSKLLNETQTRVEQLEKELVQERKDRSNAEWQLTFLQAMDGKNRTLPPPR